MEDTLRKQSSKEASKNEYSLLFILYVGPIFHNGS